MDWPRQYANSCLRRAEREENAAAMAWIAGSVLSVGGCRQARCLREKRARNRRARGSDSEVRVLRRARMVGSTPSVVSIAAGAMVTNGENDGLSAVVLSVYCFEACGLNFLSR